MRLLRALAALVVVVSLAAGAHIAHAFLQPVSGPDRVAAQVRWLNAQRDTGAAADMQALFPEGEFFTHALTGLAAASMGDAATVSSALAAIDSPAVKDRFGDIDALDGGTFYRGWRLLLLTEQTRLTGTAAAELRTEADAVLAALTASEVGVPASYPDGFWPCDAVVAMAALVRARVQSGAPLPGSELAAWLAKLDALRDPTGLLPHRIAAHGTVVDGPRGSSQAIIQTFWPDLDPLGAANQWQVFSDNFVVREAGLVGVREYPIGDHSAGDVDSGPLLFGVSASASAVTLAAARRNGDTALAADLDRQAEYLGIPLEWAGQRRFAFGLLPVGDAFVAWSRGVTLATTPATATPPRARWGWHLLVALLPGLAVGAWLVFGRRRVATSRLPPSSSRRTPGSQPHAKGDPGASPG